MRPSSYLLLLIVMATLVIDGCAMVRPGRDWNSQGRDRVFDPLTHEEID